MPQINKLNKIKAFTHKSVSAFFIPCEKSRIIKARSPPARILEILSFSKFNREDNFFADDQVHICGRHNKRNRSVERIFYIALTTATTRKAQPLERNAAAYLIGILNGKILAEESNEDNLITREQVMEFLITLPEQEPQVIIDTMIRKVVLFDDKIELHYNFCDKPEHDEPDGTSPEDRRVFPISFQSTLSSSVPPRKRR